jgi:hypothetical protein
MKRVTMEQEKALIHAGERLAAWAARAEERWSGGDLAEAVRNLAYARRAWVRIMDEIRDGEIVARLEYLRGEILAERISYGEIAELQGLKAYIQPGDMLLLEWAGVPETVEA